MIVRNFFLVYQVPATRPLIKKVRLKPTNNVSLLKSKNSLLKPGQSLLKNPPKRKLEPNSTISAKQTFQSFQDGKSPQERNGGCPEIQSGGAPKLQNEAFCQPVPREHSYSDKDEDSSENKFIKQDFSAPPLAVIENYVSGVENLAEEKPKVYCNLDLEYSLEVEIG